MGEMKNTCFCEVDPVVALVRRGTVLIVAMAC